MSEPFRRFWSAEDFRVRREQDAGTTADGRARRGLAAPRLRERDVAEHQEALARPWQGSRSVLFLDVTLPPAEPSPVIRAAEVFGAARSGGVVAWDGVAALPEGDLSIADLGDHVVVQPSWPYDQLVGAGDPPRTSSASTLGHTMGQLSRFYPLVLAGAGPEASTTSEDVVAAADVLVIVLQMTEAAGYEGLLALDAVAGARGARSKHATVSVVLDAPEPATAGLVADLTEALAQRTRAVCRIPLEASGIHGRRSWTQACAAIATLL